MMKLFRPQFTQELNGTDLDDIAIFRREGSLCQQAVDGLAGADEPLGLFADIRHGRLSYEWGAGGSLAWQGSREKAIGHV